MTDLNVNTKPSGLPYTRYVNRKLGRQLAESLQFLTPNQVTSFGFLVLIAAVLTLFQFFGTRWVVIPYFLMALNYVLDSADGQLARIKGTSSKLGEWLDHSLDGLRILMLNISLIVILTPTIYSPEHPYTIIILFLPLFSQMGHYLFSTLKDFILNQRIGDLLDQTNNSLVSGIIRWCAAPVDFGIFIMIILLGFNPTLFMWVYIFYGAYCLMVLLATTVMTLRAN